MLELKENKNILLKKDSKNGYQNL